MKALYNIDYEIPYKDRLSKMLDAKSVYELATKHAMERWKASWEADMTGWYSWEWEDCYHLTGGILQALTAGYLTLNEAREIEKHREKMAYKHYVNFYETAPVELLLTVWELASGLPEEKAFRNKGWRRYLKLAAIREAIKNGVYEDLAIAASMIHLGLIPNSDSRYNYALMLDFIPELAKEIRAFSVERQSQISLCDSDEQGYNAIGITAKRIFEEVKNRYSSNPDILFDSVDKE